MKSSYKNISQFGSNAKSEVNNPLTYCIGTNIEQRFLHGGQSDTISGQNSKECQSYLSDYCAQDWDGFCEVASVNNSKFPNNLSNNQNGLILELTAGDALIRNTASKKYLNSMGNCVRKYQPFDPTVASSPLISYWSNEGILSQNNCIPVYTVDPKTIDSDIVMDKILQNPKIAIDILTNIYNSMKRLGTYDSLKETKLGKFFEQTFVKKI